MNTIKTNLIKFVKSDYCDKCHACGIHKEGNYDLVFCDCDAGKSLKSLCDEVGIDAEGYEVNGE